MSEVTPYDESRGGAYFAALDKFRNDGPVTIDRWRTLVAELRDVGALPVVHAFLVFASNGASMKAEAHLRSTLSELGVARELQSLCEIARDVASIAERANVEIPLRYDWRICESAGHCEIYLVATDQHVIGVRGIDHAAQFLAEGLRDQLNEGGLSVREN